MKEVTRLIPPEVIGAGGIRKSAPQFFTMNSKCYRLHGVFLTALGADEIQIEASFSQAIRIAKEQKSVSLEKRAEATYAEYQRQKASASPGRGFRLPVW
jgi:hypothetical protein